MIKILHTADIHLDSPLKSLAMRDAALRELIQTASRDAFVRIVDFALSENVSAVLIAGDLFDGAERSAKTAAFLNAQLDRLNVAAIQVFYIKGNHDAENPITGVMDFPPNVHVFDGRGGKVQLADLDVWVHGVSFSGRQAPDSLLPKFSAPVSGAVNIGMLHTSLGGAQGHDTYAPCSIAQLQGMGFDYWALGHVHKRQIHSQAPWIVMPGIPQGRDIGEAGAKSATLLTIVDGAVSLEEVPTSKVEFLEQDLDIAPFESDVDLRQALRQAAHGWASELGSDMGLVRVRFTGATARRWQLLRDRDSWEEAVAEALRATGRLWLEAFKLEVVDAGHQPGSPAATDELAVLIQDILGEEGTAGVLSAEFEAILAELPAQMRARLAPDEAAAERLVRQLAQVGADHVLALMKGVTS